jgi:hypothetical protein
MIGRFLYIWLIHILAFYGVIAMTEEAKRAVEAGYLSWYVVAALAFLALCTSPFAWAMSKRFSNRVQVQ